MKMTIKKNAFKHFDSNPEPESVNLSHSPWLARCDISAKKLQVRTLEHTPLTVTVDERVCLNMCGPDAQFTEMNATTIGYPASVLIVIDC